LQIKSISSADTEHYAQVIGANLCGGEIIELRSDLGGGKTTFTRGLVVGTGSADDVASPTFTISRVYNAPKFTIHHFDFYRLTEPGIIAHELQELINDPSVVIVIEWGDIVADVIATEHTVITIEQQQGNERELIFEVPEKYQYITKGLKQ